MKPGKALDWENVLKYMKAEFPQVADAFTADKLRTHMSYLQSKPRKESPQEYLKLTPEMEAHLMDCFKKQPGNNWESIRRSFLKLYPKIKISADGL